MKHFYKKLPIVKFIGVLMFLLASIPRLEAASFWTDANNYDISWYSSESDEYSISSSRQLAGLAYLVNHECVDFLNKTISLTEDIDLSGHLWIPIGNGIKIPVENESEKGTIAVFSGSFNGNGHTVSGLTIDASTLNPDHNFCCAIGLFGYIETFSESAIKIAEIYDLKISGASITMRQSTEAYKYMNLGTLAGSAFANIHDVAVESTIEFFPSNLFTKISAGGVAGYGIVTNCTFDGTISIKSDSNSFLGGITGTGDVTNCINTGDLYMYGIYAEVGGITGNGNVNGSINKGNIHVKGKGGIGYGFSATIGGITGDGTVINSGNYGNIDSDLYAIEFGSNTVILGALIGSSYLNRSINNYNFGTIFSKTHNAGLETVGYLNEYYGDDNKFLSNSYTLVPGGDGEYREFSNSIDPKSESYLKSEEFLDLLNQNAIAINKSHRSCITQNWIVGESGFPILSGKNIYPLIISEDYSSKGDIQINGDYFHEGDNVNVTVIPSEGFCFEKAILSYGNDTNYHYITFNAEELGNNSFSFEMPPYICNLKFIITSGSGVSNIEFGNADTVSVYSTDGILLYEGIFKDANLNKGIYIVKSLNGTKKILIK